MFKNIGKKMPGFKLRNEQFCLTEIHEIAHRMTWKKYRDTVDPHGKEWQTEFKKISFQFLNGHYPIKVTGLLFKHLKNPNANSGACLECKCK